MENTILMEHVERIITSPWPWYVAGPIIAMTMAALLYYGKSLGISANFRTMCAMAGAGKSCGFFRFDWQNSIWNLVFLGGLLIGGVLAGYLGTAQGPDLSPVTKAELAALGIENPGAALAPQHLFSWQALGTWQGIVAMVVGGFLVGFGTRYAGGCTSGHAISGLSNLQWPSLIAVAGFFIGGLAATNFVLPLLLAP